MYVYVYMYLYMYNHIVMSLKGYGHIPILQHDDCSD